MCVFTRRTLLTAMLLGLSSGCSGGKYDLQRVEGTVTLVDGTPLEGLQLSFECTEPRINAKATTDASGHYRLGTLQRGDGAPTGQYKVAVIEPDVITDEKPPPRIHAKYAWGETSGLEFTVEDGRNTFDIQLDPP